MRLVLAIVLLLPALAGAAGVRPMFPEGTPVPPGVLALLERGYLGLVEDGKDDHFDQVSLAVPFGAERERVFDTIMAVERYPDFVPKMRTKVLDKTRAGIVSYEWELEYPIVTIGGVAGIRGLRPSLIEQRVLRGEAADTQERWELRPLAGARALGVFQRWGRLENVGTFLKMLLKASPTMEASLSLGRGLMHAREMQRGVQSLPPPERRPSDAVEPLQSLGLGERVSLEDVLPLCRRGVLVLLELTPNGRFRQVTAFTFVAAPMERVLEVIAAPEKYPEFLQPYHSVDVTRDGDVVQMQYEIEIPVFNMSGLTRMHLKPPDRASMIAVDGDIQHGYWEWRLHAIAGGTVIEHGMTTDLAHATVVLRQITEVNPLLESVIHAATAYAVVRSTAGRVLGKDPGFTR